MYVNSWRDKKHASGQRIFHHKENSFLYRLESADFEDEIWKELRHPHPQVDDVQDENVDLSKYPMEHPVLGTLENEDEHYEKLGYTKHPELGWIQ